MAYYQPRIYQPHSQEPYRLSRSKIDLYLHCPRCFYLDQRLGIKTPGLPSFSLNQAVDTLLKKEFDIHRANGNPHPLMEHYHVDAVPFQHPKMEEWRDALRRGIQYHHQPTDLLITGGIDDLWIDRTGSLLVVDYKATSTDKVISLDDKWKESYKRQIEIYQWLFRRNNFPVSQTGYFVFCNGLTDKVAFDGKLEFHLQIIPYQGDDSWVENVLFAIHDCLNTNHLPDSHPDCEYCRYVRSASQAAVTE